MSKEITTQSKELVAALSANMPAEASFQRIQLPRLGMYSQDVTEGKGKAMKVIAEAGTFYTEKETDELDETTGKKKWVKEEIGTSFKGTVTYFRKQLSMYADEKYTNSPIYDSEEDIVPLFCDKKEVARGNPKELKAKYAFVDPKDNKKKSKLADQKILYVLLDGVTHQMTLKGTSMYSFNTYLRSSIPPTVETLFSSEEKENGATVWNMMTFKTVRPLDSKEMEEVLSIQHQIKSSVAAEKAYYASLSNDTVEETQAEREMRTGESLNLPDGQGF